MTTSEALNIFKITLPCDLATVKLTYRKLAKQYHPDVNPSGLQMMQVINEAYDQLKSIDLSTEHVQSAESNFKLSDDIEAALNNIISLEGLDITVCGTWIWVSGDTKEHKDILKASKFMWASKKKMWYWKPEGERSKSRSKMSFDDIKASHGSYSVKTKPTTKLRRA